MADLQDLANGYDPFAAEQYANPLVKLIMGGIAQTAAAPGNIAKPNPYPTGSEEADWYDRQRSDAMVPSAVDLAGMTTLGAATVPAEANSLRAGASVLKSSMAKDVKPVVIDAYHGTTKEIGQFMSSKGGEFGPGVYLADTPEMASYFGGREGNEGLNIIRANVELQKPFTVTKQDWIAMTRNKTPMQVHAKLKQQGYDGIIGVGLNGVDKQIVPFDTKSIKPRYTSTPVDHDPFDGAVQTPDGTWHKLNDK